MGLLSTLRRRKPPCGAVGVYRYPPPNVCPACAQPADPDDTHAAEWDCPACGTFCARDPQLDWPANAWWGWTCRRCPDAAADRAGYSSSQAMAVGDGSAHLAAAHPAWWAAHEARVAAKQAQGDRDYLPALYTPQVPASVASALADADRQDAHTLTAKMLAARWQRVVRRRANRNNDAWWRPMPLPAGDRP